MKFLKKSIVFVSINTALMVALLVYFSGRDRHIRLDNWETESNLLVMGENVRYDIALLGTSRGRVFSRDDNHRMLETILGRSVINLSKGGGGGLMPAKLHLAHFFERGNRADHIVYLLDAWIFFSPINNENNTFFLRDEPFELSILAQLIRDGFPLAHIWSYLQMIAVDDWRQHSRYAAPGLTENTLPAIDADALEKARRYYLQRYEQKHFEKYLKVIDVINTMAAQNNSRVTYILLPILIPDFPGVGQVVDAMNAAASRHAHVSFYNLVDVMHDRHFFYDHMHFNRAGIDHFARTYLSPIVAP